MNFITDLLSGILGAQSTKEEQIANKDIVNRMIEDNDIDGLKQYIQKAELELRVGMVFVSVIAIAMMLLLLVLKVFNIWLTILITTILFALLSMSISINHWSMKGLPESKRKRNKLIRGGN